MYILAIIYLYVLQSYVKTYFKWNIYWRVLVFEELGEYFVFYQDVLLDYVHVGFWLL